MNEEKQKRLTPEREAEIREHWLYEEFHAEPHRHASGIVDYDIVSGKGADANSVCVCYTTNDRDRLVSLPDDMRSLLSELDALRADVTAANERLRETERQFTRLRTDADKFRNLVRTLLDLDVFENAAPILDWCEQHGEDISTFLPGGAWWEHNPADMPPKLDAGEIQESLAMYVLNVDRMEVRRLLEVWRAEHGAS